MHREILAEGFVPSREPHKGALPIVRVHVGCHPRAGDPSNTTHGDVFADFLNQRFSLALQASGQQRSHVIRTRFKGLIGDPLHPSDEAFVPSGEVRLDVHLGQHSGRPIVGDADPKEPLCGGAARFFRGLQRTVLAQLLNGQLEIPSDATSACLQSIMPSPVRSRSSLTMAAVIATCLSSLIELNWRAGRAP